MPNYVRVEQNKYAATQALIWEVVTGRRNKNGLVSGYKSTSEEVAGGIPAAKDNSRNVRRVYWDCKNCQTRLGPLGDAELLAVVTNKLLTICRIPRLAETEPRAEPSLSLQATRLTNEINQILNQREVEPDRLLPLILECAAEKYKTCRIRESDHVTLRLLALFREHTEDKELDRELFEQTVKQVILQSDGSVRLRLVNDKVI